MIMKASEYVSVNSHFEICGNSSDMIEELTVRKIYGNNSGNENEEKDNVENEEKDNVELLRNSAVKLCSGILPASKKFKIFSLTKMTKNYIKNL